MALINCSECNHQASDKAEACPKCGAPIAEARETVAAGTQVKTIQETSKKFKLHTLISVSVIIIGLTWVFVLASNPQSEPSAMPALFTTAGLIWYVVNRFRIWWHHK